MKRGLTTKWPLQRLRIISLAAICGLLMGYVPALPVVADSARVQPILLAMAQEQPDEMVDIIVQKIRASDAPNRLVERLGGSISKELRIINAFAAQIPAGAVPELAATTDVRWVSLDAPVIEVSNAAHAVNYVRDEFTQTSFAGNSGTVHWGNAWMELGEADGPELGDVSVARFMGGTEQGLRIQGNSVGVMRSADLTAAQSATLRFEYRRKNFSDSDFISVEVSDDGGITWQAIDNLAGSATDDALQSASYDISHLVSADTAVRFVSSDAQNERARLYVDNVDITFTAPVGSDMSLSPTMYLPLLSSDSAIVAENDQSQIGVRAASSTQTVLDQFSTGGYAGNDGTVSWASGWVENDDDGGGASSGEIYVQSGSTNCPSGAGCLIFDPDENNDSVTRSVDLSGATWASLSYDYNATQFDTSGLAEFEVQVKDANGVWHDLAEFESESNDRSISAQVGTCSGDPIGSCSHDITPYINTDPNQPTQIRIIVAEENSNEPIGWDNIQIDYAVDTSPPSGPAGSATVLDQFSATEYGGNDGSLSWSSDWVENDDSGGGAASGEIYVQSGSANCPSGAGCLIFDPDELNDSITRSVDLSGASAATLSYDYNATQFDTSGEAEFEVQVKDSAGFWRDVARFESESNDRTITALVGTCAGDPIGSCTHDITPYINTNPSQPTQIRIIVAEANSNEPIGWDNFQIEFSAVGAAMSPVGSAVILDGFASGGYSGSEGTTGWVSSWSEDDDLGGGASGGEIYVESGADNCPSGAGCLVFDPAEEDDNITRSFDLSGSSRATLSYDYNATNFDTSGVAEFEVQVQDSAGSWHGLATFRSQSNVRTIIPAVGECSGDPIGSCSHDITPYLNTDPAQPSQIRILVTEENSSEPIGWDNFQIEYSTLANVFVQSIGAEDLWYESEPVDGRTVTVAVVDSGIVDHRDFYAAANDDDDDDESCRILAHVNFNNSGSIDDFYGHGTHVAGAIAGNGKKSEGSRAGVAPRANLVDVKVTDDYGAGSTSDVIAGLEWILNNKEQYNIRVVNVSLNSSVAESYHLSPLNAALEILWFNGIVVVVSAGNNGTTDSGVLFPPANDPFLIAVGAVDDKNTKNANDDTVASFSAFGITTDGFSKPDILAPGVDIISPLASDDSNLVIDHPAHAVAGATGNNYFRMSGTSMASAVVAGAVALLLQDEPGLTPDQVKYRLMNTANTSWPAYNPAMAGAGILDINAAVKGTSTESANTGLQASQLLWTGSDPVNWGSVNWGSVNWGSVNWGSVNWGSVNWGSVSWGSVHWDD